MNTNDGDISPSHIEENVFSKPKCQILLSFIAHFQQNNKNIQRAHLIHALVKNEDTQGSQRLAVEDRDEKKVNLENNEFTDQMKQQKRLIIDTNLLDDEVMGRLQILAEKAPKIMFNSIANLDKTIQYLRKLGLITNQYLRGYPRIILTDKGLILFYRYLIKSMIDELIHDGSELFNISDHIITTFIGKEKKEIMVSSYPPLILPEGD